jgi:hypothetical protein
MRASAYFSSALILIVTRAEEINEVIDFQPGGDEPFGRANLGIRDQMTFQSRLSGRIHETNTSKR